MDFAKQLRNGLGEQWRVFYALLLREIQTRFGKHRVGYAWAVVEPALHVGTLYALRSLLGGVTPQHVPMLLWLISGIVPFFMFRSIISRVVGAARGNADLLVLPPVRLMDIIWSRMVLELATYSAILLCFFGLYRAFIGPLDLHDPLGLAACLLALAVLGLGFGMMTTVLVSLFPALQPLVDGVMRLLYFASGVMFSINMMPPALQDILVWNVLLHVFELLHAAMFESYSPAPQASLPGYIVLCGLGSVVAGILLIGSFRRVVMEPNA